MRREPRPTGMKPILEIPDASTWTYIVAADPLLFRPDWPYRQPYRGWISFTRMIEIDGVKVAAHFVATEQEKHLLTSQGGWKDVTDRWKAQQNPEPAAEREFTHIAALKDPPNPDCVIHKAHQPPPDPDAWTWARIKALKWNDVRSEVKGRGGNAVGSRVDLEPRLASLVGVAPAGA